MNVESFRLRSDRSTLVRICNVRPHTHTPLSPHPTYKKSANAQCPSQLLDEEERTTGIKVIRAFLDTTIATIDACHVWSAGGDGTFMWVLEELLAAGVDVNDPRMNFCTVPFGTGNDLSQVMGWGGSVPGDPMGGKLANLDRIVSERLEGQKAYLDIWEIEIVANENGFIKKAVKVDPNFDLGGAKEKRIVRKMSNYSSIGVQGFVGARFEPHRHTSRFMNALEFTDPGRKLMQSSVSNWPTRE
ncbi:hypothetical protein BDK51DRAFT_29023, partial [Blyttiomyces helicus]